MVHAEVCGVRFDFVIASVFKADLLSDLDNSKQSMKSVNLPLTCHPTPSLIKKYNYTCNKYIFFGEVRSSVVRYLLLD